LPQSVDKFDQTPSFIAEEKCCAVIGLVLNVLAMLATTWLIAYMMLAGDSFT